MLINHFRWDKSKLNNHMGTATKVALGIYGLRIMLMMKMMIMMLMMVMMMRITKHRQKSWHEKCQIIHNMLKNPDFISVLPRTEGKSHALKINLKKYPFNFN